MIDERRVPLGQVAPRVATQLANLYDFGDSWENDLLLEAILIPETSTPYPKCIGGERRTPAGDVGGNHGYYEEYLAVLADPEHEDMKTCCSGEAHSIQKRSHPPR